MQVTNNNTNINILAETDGILYTDFEKEKIVLPVAIPGYNVQLTFSLTRDGKVILQIMKADPVANDPIFLPLMKGVLKGDTLVINANLQELPK